MVRDMKTVPLLDLKAQYATIREEIREAIDRVCESQHFIMGPEVKALEEEVGAFCGARYAIGMSSGTDALLGSAHGYRTSTWRRGHYDAIYLLRDSRRHSFAWGGGPFLPISIRRLLTSILHRRLPRSRRGRKRSFQSIYSGNVPRWNRS